MSAQLVEIRCEGSNYLEPGDTCWHIGRYLVGGGYDALDNQQVLNFKIKPPVPENRLKHKQGAIDYWARRLAKYVETPIGLLETTYIPVPPSKPNGHPNFDNRVHDMLLRLKKLHPMIDVRPVVYTKIEREAQSRGGRIPVEQLMATMDIDFNQLNIPLRRVALIVDDVFTTGRSYAAVRNFVKTLPGVENVGGIFLARSEWQAPDLGAFGF